MASVSLIAPMTRRPSSALKRRMKASTRAGMSSRRSRRDGASMGKTFRR